MKVPYRIQVTQMFRKRLQAHLSTELAYLVIHLPWTHYRTNPYLAPTIGPTLHQLFAIYNLYMVDV